MANRSDFYNAKIPRQIKKMIALQPFLNEHERGQQKRLWAEAHAAHIRSKTKRIDADTSSED